MSEFDLIVRELGMQLVYRSNRVAVGEWQAQDVSDKPLLVTHEVTHTTFKAPMPQTVTGMQSIVKPNLPWAEDHFLERVSGKPLNPPPSHVDWPFAQRGNEEHVDGGQFSHTYPERFWPKWTRSMNWPLHGVRYDYGDLADVVEMLKRNPLTRQAYLPVWFPEDTGATSGQRVPCTLGYHFLIRQGCLDIDYHIRSCDFLRHFRDDVYMAMRLALWMSNQLVPRPDLSRLVMHIGSLHVFEGDKARMEREFS